MSAATQTSQPPSEHGGTIIHEHVGSHIDAERCHRLEKVEITDQVGLFASLLCALHCVGGALLLVVAPTLGDHIMHNEWFHHAMAALVLGIAVLAFGRGYYRHRIGSIAALGALGTAIVVGALTATHYGLSHETERNFTIVGSLILILAHYRNIRALKTCLSLKPHCH